MKLKTSSQSDESERVREQTNAYEVLMPRPRSSLSPKKLESPRPAPEDETLERAAKENRASNKKNLQKMLQIKSEKLIRDKSTLVEKKAKKSMIAILPSDSEEEQLDLTYSDKEHSETLKVKKCTRRKILSESESDADEIPTKNCLRTKLSSELQQSKLNFKPQDNLVNEESNAKKRNSLLNYFNSVSKEEAKKTAEQIKVTAHIHSPPATPGRKPTNQKSPVDSTRRSARMQLCYETCDHIEVVSSEQIAAAPSITPVKTPIKTPVKKTKHPKVETPNRALRKTPGKLPEKKKEKPDYVKNLKLKIRAPVKSGATVEKFILSSEALEELFLSPDPKKKEDTCFKRKRKKNNLTVLNNNLATANITPRNVHKTPEKSPEKNDTLVITPQKINASPKNSHEAEPSNRPTKRTSPRKMIAASNNTLATKIAVSETKEAARGKIRGAPSGGSKSPGRSKSAGKIGSPVIPNKPHSSSSPKAKEGGQPVNVALPTSTISNKGKASSSKRSAFEEIMSKKYTKNLSDKESNAEIHKKTKSKSATVALKESLKSDKSNGSNLSLAKVNGTKSEIEDVVFLPVAVRKSKRILSSETRKKQEEEVKDPKKLPKLKKRKRVTSSDGDDDTGEDDVVILSETKSKSSAKAPLKMAPMFMKRNSKLPEKIEDPAAIAAKKRFLSSGVPDCIKKIAELHSRPELEFACVFPSVSHVKQEEAPGWTLSDVHLPLSPDDGPPFLADISTTAPGSLTEHTPAARRQIRPPTLPTPIQSYRRILEKLKLENPNYCVNRNYKRLKSKFTKRSEAAATAGKAGRGRKRRRLQETAAAHEPSVAWTEKYRPTSAEEVVGNARQVLQLKEWLEVWKRFYKSDDPRYDVIKRKRSLSGSSDEFIVDDQSEDEDGRQMPRNTALVSGPSGCGKTSAVYAVAEELGYQVLEINASSKRTGKHLLKLHEATQSHRVCAKPNAAAAAAAAASFFAPSAKHKRDKDKTSLDHQDDAHSKMSLILIENADIIFEEQDEGFAAALASLVQTSKRPVVMLANDATRPHLCRLTEQAVSVSMSPPPPGPLSAWLQLVCLVEGASLDADAARRLVARCRADVPRCLNLLHFWTLSGGDLALVGGDLPLYEVDEPDEGTPRHDDCVELFGAASSSQPVELTQVWWNLAHALSLPQPTCRRDRPSPASAKSEGAGLSGQPTGCELEGAGLAGRPTGCELEGAGLAGRPTGCEQAELDALALLMDGLAAADETTACPRLAHATAGAGPCPRVWERARGCGEGGDGGGGGSIAHFLVERGVAMAARALGATRRPVDVGLPSLEHVGWLEEQHAADEEMLGLLRAGATLDRRSACVDFLPAMHSMCRHESVRLGANTKRGNRFKHYLHGLGSRPSNEQLQLLGQTFRRGLWRCQHDKHRSS